MSWFDDEDWNVERVWEEQGIRDDLPLDDAVRILEMWTGEKATRVKRHAKRLGHKSEPVRGPHAEVTHETKKTVMDALSDDDLKSVGSKNPDVYIKSSGKSEDDDLIVIVRPTTQAKNEGRGKKHITNVHARDILGEDYRDKINVLKLTTINDPIVFVLTEIEMSDGRIFHFIQRQVEDNNPCL